MGLPAAQVKPVRPLPYAQGAAITPTDSLTFSAPYDALLCAGDGGAAIGYVKVDFWNGGGADVILPIFHGYPLDVLVGAVHATDTTADSVIGLKRGSAS